MSAAERAAESLCFEDVSLTYPNGTKALDHIQLTIPKGQFVCLLGPSGCGKSTLLKLASGLVKPSTGSVQRSSAECSYVFQEPTLMPWAKLTSNVQLPMDLRKRQNAAPLVERAIKQVGLTGFEQHYPHQLSGGMQMRASIARALVTEPQILLMDEPFGALDEITRHKLDQDLIAWWMARPELTVVFVTHSVAEAVFLGQRVVVMGAHPGRIVHDTQISTPYPRTPEFRTSELLNRTVRELHEVMGTP